VAHEVVDGAVIHAGPVELRVPKLRSLPFETAIIERYRRRESSVEHAPAEMYLVGTSARRSWWHYLNKGQVNRMPAQRGRSFRSRRGWASWPGARRPVPLRRRALELDHT
jgi:hypothetical protein